MSAKQDGMDPMIPFLPWDYVPGRFFGPLVQPPALEPPDALAVPCSRRDQLAMFADLATVLAENPTMLPGDAVDLVWQRWTVRYRTPEQPTREG